MSAKRLPIKAAREVGTNYSLDQVILLGWSRSTGLTHVVTWGRTLEDCDQAAQGGNRMKSAMAWPESDCQGSPARVERLFDRIATLEAERAALIALYSADPDPRVAMVRERKCRELLDRMAS